MKNNVILLVGFALIMLVSCESNETKGGGVPPPPPDFYLDGTITNIEGLPIDSIQVALDSLSSGLLRGYGDTISYPHQYISYSNNEGDYSIVIEGVCSQSVYMWPKEVVVIATDPFGVYETQTQTVPIDILCHETREFVNAVAKGTAHADFVMQKKVE